MSMEGYKQAAGHTKWDEYKKDEPMEDTWTIAVPKQ